MLASLLIVVLLVGVAVAFIAFIFDEGSVGSKPTDSGYRYDFNEHQNYWAEDK